MAYNSFGIIAVTKSDPRLYLVVQSGRNGHWGFAKGAIEQGETPKQGALRELEEETGMRNVSIIPNFEARDSYEVNDKGNRKNVTLFIGVSEDTETKIDGDEISDVKWLPYEEALETITYPSSQEILRKAESHLTSRM